MESISIICTERYHWRQISAKPSIWQRPALAGECWWTQRPKELREIFLCSSLTLNIPIPRRTFNTRLRDAWRLLRFQVPELGLNAVCSTNGKIFLQYHDISDEEAQKWVDRTHSCQSESHEQDFEHIRKSLHVDMENCGSVADNAFLLTCAISEHGLDLVTHTQIMISIDHQISDGIGTRIIFGQFLALLASSLGSGLGTTETDIKWENSHQNLSQPWITCMNEHQLVSGPVYEEATVHKQDVILNQMKHNPGLPLLQDVESGKQEVHFITLSENQTTALLQAIKRNVGPKSNITHLGHAATVLALLRRISHTLTPSQTFYSPCWLNGRRYLSSLELTHSFIPICQSFAPIVFKELEQLVLSPSASKEETRDLLVKSCRIATAEYEIIKGKKSMLTECVTLFEKLGMDMALNKNMNAPTKVPEELIQNLNIAPQVADPVRTPFLSSDTARPQLWLIQQQFFLSDGIAEQYISYTYPIPPSPPDDAYESVMIVDTIQFAAHAEKNLIVRMSSWRGQTTVSGEWRSCDLKSDMVVQFLEDVVGIMMQLLDSG